MPDFDNAFETEKRRLDAQEVNEIDRISRSQLRWRNAIPAIQDIFAKAASILREKDVPMGCAVAKSGRWKLRLTRSSLWDLNCQHSTILLDKQGTCYRVAGGDIHYIGNKGVESMFGHQIRRLAPLARIVAVNPRQIELDPEAKLLNAASGNCDRYSWQFGVNGSGFPIIFDDIRDPSPPVRLDIEVAKSVARLVHEGSK